MKFVDRSVRALKPKGKRYEAWIDGYKGLGIRVSVEGTKSWVLLYRHEGRLRRMTLGRYPAVGVAQAGKLHAEAIEKVEHGIDPAAEAIHGRQEERTAATDKTVDAVFEAFNADHLVKLRRGDDVKRQFERDVLPQWGRRRVDQITRADIRELLRVKAEEAPISANRLLAALRKFFNWCIDEEIIQASPAIRIKPPTDERERVRDRVLSESEIALIWQAADEMGEPFGDVIKMMFFSAGRRSEIINMTWPEIDLVEVLWRLPAARHKTKTPHVLPLTPAAMELLGARYETDKPKAGASMPEHIFRSGRSGDRPMSGYSKFKERIDLLVAKARAKDDNADIRELSDEAILEAYRLPDWRFHDIRRTSATYMRQGGADRLTVQKILGHADSSVTSIYDRYGSLDEMRRALETWATRLAIIVGGDDGGKVVPIRRAE